MRILMDQPQAYAPFGPVEPTAAAAEPDELELWAGLAGARAPLAAAAPAALDRGFWRAGYAVATAPGSQYDLLRILAAAGQLPAGNLFCLAGQGRGFHGQHGRSWQALPGNLHLSVALAAELPVPGWGPALPALPAVAALDAVRRCVGGGPRVGLKWVNDVLADEAKLGGVLTAVRTRAGRIEQVFLGIGLNVAATPQLPADPFVSAVTCLADLGSPAPDPVAMAMALLAAVQARFVEFSAHGPDELLRAYREGSLVIGRRVSVHPDAGSPPGAAGVRHGTVAAIGDDLALHLAEGGPPVAHGRLVLDPA